MLDGNYGRVSRQELLELMDHGDAVENARLRAYDYAEAARKNLEVLLQTEYREALGDLPAFVIERNR
jgi:geranylgeranyl pyrophosphate synthase